MSTNIELNHAEALPDAAPEELARIIVARFGLLPRKKDGSAKMQTLLLEMYERKKSANREKKPELAVMPVEQMGFFAGIKRQTMYDYLRRWLDLNIVKKTSFVNDGKVVIGYELNGATMKDAFEKAATAVKNHLEHSLILVDKLQNEIKREKIKDSMATKKDSGSEKDADSSDAIPNYGETPEN